MRTLNPAFNPLLIKHEAKLNPFSICCNGTSLLVGSQRQPARHLTWKLLYCNNVITFYWPSISTSGERGLLGNRDECALCHFWIISCMWVRCEPRLSDPPGRGGLSVVAVRLHAWKLRAAVMKDFSGKVQSHIRGNAFNVSKSRCMGFYFCLCYIPLSSFWPTDSH